MRVAGEHLVAQGEAVKRHHQRDAYLLAVGAVIAGVPALRLWIAFCLAFEICARNVVKQHFILDRKQLAATLRQMCFERGLVHEQMIKRAIEAVLVDLLITELQQIG